MQKSLNEILLEVIPTKKKNTMRNYKNALKHLCEFLENKGYIGAKEIYETIKKALPWGSYSFNPMSLITSITKEDVLKGFQGITSEKGKVLYAFFDGNRTEIWRSSPSPCERHRL